MMSILVQDLETQWTSIPAFLPTYPPVWAAPEFCSRKILDGTAASGRLSLYTPRELHNQSMQHSINWVSIYILAYLP